jgi:2-polyprenyl-3-methyl-5-hydroxy-6-metoxy-1,4-benzoquinol methylase
MNYDAKGIIETYTSKVEEHWYTMFNPMMQYLGNYENKTILDLGCGSGDFTDELAKKAKNVLGIDASKKWIDYCNAHHKKKNLKFMHLKAQDLKSVHSHSIDIIILNMVLINVPKKKDVMAIFKEVGRVLRSNGDFIFSDLHPICIMTPKEGNRGQKYSKNFTYFKNGARCFTSVKTPDNKKIVFVNNHWSIEFYTDQLIENNMHIEKIMESNYPKDAPKKFFRYSFPEYILFCCKKHT